MRILLDHNVPRRVTNLLDGHEVKTTRKMGWEELANGELLRRAAESFEVFVSTDKKLRFEQNLKKLPLPVVVLDVVNNSYAAIVPLAPFLQTLLSSPLERILYFIRRDGQIIRYGSVN